MGMLECLVKKMTPLAPARLLGPERADLANGARHTFFEQAVFDLGPQPGFSLSWQLSLEVLDFVRGRLTRCVATQPLLARF